MTSASDQFFMTIALAEMTLSEKESETGLVWAESHGNAVRLREILQVRVSLDS
jgi:hypothetical protein